MTDLFKDIAISREEQIRCVEREIRLRVGVYQRRVTAGLMDEKEADYQLRAMAAVLGTIKSEGKDVMVRGFYPAIKSADGKAKQ